MLRLPTQEAEAPVTLAAEAEAAAAPETAPATERTAAPVEAVVVQEIAAAAAAEVEKHYDQNLETCTLASCADCVAVCSFLCGILFLYK